MAAIEFTWESPLIGASDCAAIASAVKARAAVMIRSMSHLLELASKAKSIRSSERAPNKSQRASSVRNGLYLQELAWHIGAAQERRCPNQRRSLVVSARFSMFGADQADESVGRIPYLYTISSVVGEGAFIEEDYKPSRNCCFRV